MIIERDKDQLNALLLQGGPAQMLDGIRLDTEDLKKGLAKISGLKTIKADDPWLEGHFPGNPIFPGHCLSECCNLAALALVLFTMPEIRGVPVIVGSGKTTFRKSALVGNELSFEVTLAENKRRQLVFDAIVKNQKGEVVAEVFGIKGMIKKI